MNATSFRPIVIASLAGLFLAAAAPLARAQSLADIARKEEERRKAAPQPAKVYTNKDLTPAPAPSSPPSPAPGGAAGDAKAGGDAKDAAAKDAAGDKDKGEVKDQAYWTGKLKNLQQQLDRDSSFADALQTKINSLTTDFVNRDDPVQKRQIEADRNKALAELDRLKKAVVDDNKAIASLQEEARRAGVPPGWLR